MMRRILIVALFLICPSLLYAQATNYCVNQSYNTFEGGTVGAQPTAVSLNASQHGYNGGNWSPGGGTVMTYSNVDMKALVAPGRLCADSTTYTNGVGTTGIVFTGDGGLDFNTEQYNLGASIPADVWASIEYNEDYGDGDPSKIDAFVIHGTNDFALLNAYGTSNPGGHRFFNIEVSTGTSTNVNWEPSTSCPCKILLHYQSGNGTTKGTHELFVYDKNGLLLGHLTALSTVGPDVANRVAFGDVQNGQNVTAGKHSWFDNMQVSVENSAPGQFCKGASPTWTSSPDNTTMASCLSGASAGDTINVLSGTATWNAVQVQDNGINIAGATTCTGTGTSTASCTDNTVLNWSNEASWYFLIVPAGGACNTVTTLSGLTINWLSGVGSSSNGALWFNNSNCSWPLSGPQMRLTNTHIVTSPTGGGGSVFSNVAKMFGVIDHVLYVRNSGNTGMFGMDGDRGNRGYPPWQQDVGWGTTKALYIETSTFIDNAGTNTEGPIDCYAGARYVFRFNYVSGTHQGGCHGTDTDTTRSVMLEESYGNVQLNNNTSSINYTSSSPVRGGTAFIFGETYQVQAPGVSWAGVELQCDRCAASTCTSPVNGACPNWGLAASQLYLQSTDVTSTGAVTSTATPGVQFCGPKGLDNIIATGNNSGCAALNASDTASGFLDGGQSTTSAYPVRDQAGRAHIGTQGQALAPVYMWSLSPTAAGQAFVFPSTTNIQECRDFYQQFNGPFTGACTSGNGVGVGLLSNRPACNSGCSTGVGWFATDQGTWNTGGGTLGSLGVVSGVFYTLTALGTWTPYYTPLTYPHPLVAAALPVAATPQFTPAPGGYTDTTVSRPPNTALPNFPWGSTTITPTATIMDNTPGATICYTTNGTPPKATTAGTCDALAGEVAVPAGSYPCASPTSASGCAGSTAGYNQFAVQLSALAAVPVNHVNTTIKAIATEVGYTNSAENDATYVIDSACGPAPTIVGSVTATTGLDGQNGIGVTDGLAYINLSFTTSIPTNAQYEIGGINVHTPYQTSGIQNATGTTNHSFAFTGLFPGVINWGYGVTASTVIQSGANAGQVCGSGSQAVFTPAYTSGSGSIVAATATRADTTNPISSYRVTVNGSHHVTAGYSTYFFTNFINLAGANPPNGSMTMTITGEPTTGTSFNWMSVGNKTTGACLNHGILSTDGADVLSQTNVCNDTNNFNVFISGSLPGREIQFVTSPSTPPGTYLLNLTMSSNSAQTPNCLAACNANASTTWQIIVDPANAPYGVSSVTFPKTAPSSYPAIPNQVVYTNRITEYGQNHLNCAQDGTSGNDVIRPNDNSTLLTIGPAGQQASWYYDGVNAWLTADSLRQNWAGDGPAGTMLSWSQCRQDQVEMYRDKGVLAGFGGLTNQTFSQGYHDDYQIGGGLGGKTLDLQEVTTMVTTPQSPIGPANANYLDIDLRAIGYNMRSYIHGVHLGIDQPQPISSISGTGATGPFTLTFTTPLFNTTPPGYWPFPKKGTASQPMVVATSSGSVEPAVYNTTWLTDQNAGTQATASFQVVANMPPCGIPTATNCGQAYISPTSTGYNVGSQGTTQTPMRAFLDYNVDHVLAQLEQACITQDPTQQNWELFFIGTSTRELIEYYNLITPDPRIPPIVKTCADFLWTQFQKQPTNVGTWFYVQATQFEGANLQTQNGTNCNSPEDALNVPMYAWLYNYYGLPIYQQEGDYLFGLNATFSTGNDVLANGVFAQLPGGCYTYDGPHSIMGIGGGPTGKNFSQGLYWGPQLNYVTARNPQFNIFPGSVGVFNVTKGTASAPQIITLTNPVNPGVAASKVIGVATVTGTNAANFTLTQTGCGNTTLAVGSTCTMSIIFTPTAGTTVITAYGGTPTVPNTFLNIPITGGSTYHVPLYGTGVNGYAAQPTYNPAPGTYAGTQNVQFTSTTPGAEICLATSNGNLSSGNGNIVGTGGGTCFGGITPIASGSTTPISSTSTLIRTGATAAGYADSVGLPNLAYTITSTPTTTVTPNPINFPATNINTTSAAMLATITNTGALPVVVTQAQVFATVFTLVNGTCFTQFGSNTSFTLPVGGSCNWGITFTPTATISYVGGCPSSNCFAVTDNAQGSPQTINLNGTGTQATIVWSSPQGGTTYNYGNLVIGNFVDSNPLTLQNTGSGPLNVNVILSGTSYSITSTTCPGVLAAGTSCTYTIRFAPTSVASFPGSLTETDSLASNSPQSLTLAGAGVNPPTQQVAPAPWVIIARRKGR